jgi:hypothetical protein
LDVRSPVVEVEGVEVFLKDGTEVPAVEEGDRFVVEEDFEGANTETDRPHEGGEPPGESRTIALLTAEPRFGFVGEFLGQHGGRHEGLGFPGEPELRGGDIGSNAGTIDSLGGG